MRLCSLVVATIAFAVPLALAIPVQDSVLSDPLGAEFLAWTSKHAKLYPSPEEKLHRFTVWKNNRDRVHKHNYEAARGLHSFRLGMNHLADLTNDEYRQQLLGLRVRFPRTDEAVGTFVATPNSSPPTDWDWRAKGVITNVKNQLNCGSCWAFSAVASMEGQYNKANNGSISKSCTSTCGPDKVPCCSFSEQEIVDCTLNGKDTCKIGGEMHDGMLEIAKQMKGFINTEDQYPYDSGNGKSSGKCRAKTEGAVQTGINGYKNVTHGDETALMHAAYEQPGISIGIDASNFAFQMYSDGVYTDTKCGNTIDKLDHGVFIVGYGVFTGPAPGPNPGPPGPPGPGPANCPDNDSEAKCNKESGCHWCVPPGGGDGFCFSFPCESSVNKKAEFIATAQDGQPYWLVKNSWGAQWGQEGYIMMARNNNNMCGVATDAQYAVIG